MLCTLIQQRCIMSPREQLLEDLANQGWAVSDGLIDAHLHQRLYDQCLQAWEHGQFKPAGVGNGRRLALHTAIRGDSICWTEPQLAELAALDRKSGAEGKRVAD